MPSSIVSRISRSRFASTAAAAILSTSIGVSGWQNRAIAQSTPYTSTVTCTNPPIPSVRTNRPDPTWEPGTGGILLVAPGSNQILPPRAVSAVVFSPDGAVLASGGAEPVINIWDTRTLQNPVPETQKTQSIALQENEQVLSLAFSPDGNCLASGGINGEVRLWDWRTGRLLQTLQERSTTDSVSNVQSLAFSPDGQTLASGSLDGYIRFWNVSDGSLVQTIEVNPGVEELAFAPDGATVTVISIRGNIEVWDWQREEPVLIRSRSTQSPSQALTISLDGQVLVFSSDQGILSDASTANPEPNSIYLVNAQDLRQIGEPLRGHSNIVRDLDFSPSGQQLISAGSDATVRIWDVQRQTLIRLFERGRNTGAISTSLERPVFSASFHPSGRAFAVGRNDGSIQVYFSKD